MQTFTIGCIFVADAATYRNYMEVPMRNMARSAALSVALFLAYPAIGSAQEADESSDPEIVVTGTRDRAEQVRDFVGVLTPAPGGTIPRFTVDSVCPAVSGLVPAQKEAVTTRLRAVIGAVGIPLGARGCVPNIFLIATPDKRAFIELLGKKRPYSFGAMTAREIRRLARSPGPTAAWQLEGPVDSSGVPIRFDENPGVFVNRTTDASSRITTVGRRGFDAAALVVETGALSGLTTVQLADYAAMRLLVKMDPARLPAGAPTTILTALTTPMGSPVANTLTRWDLGLLRGLYGSSLALNPAQQRSQIGGGVTRELDTPDPQRD